MTRYPNTNGDRSTKGWDGKKDPRVGVRGPENKGEEVTGLLNRVHRSTHLFDEVPLFSGMMVGPGVHTWVAGRDPQTTRPGGGRGRQSVLELLDTHNTRVHEHTPHILRPLH